MRVHHNVGTRRSIEKIVRSNPGIQPHEVMDIIEGRGLDIPQFSAIMWEMISNGELDLSEEWILTPGRNL